MFGICSPLKASVFKTFSFFEYFRELFLHTKGKEVLEWEVGKQAYK